MIINDYHIGMTIRELREDASLSQRKLARMIGMTNPAIRRIEALGSTKSSTVELLATALGRTEQEIHQALKETRQLFQSDN